MQKKNILQIILFLIIIIIIFGIYLLSQKNQNIKLLKKNDNQESILEENTDNDSNPLFTFGNAKIKKDNGILFLSLNN